MGFKSDQAAGTVSVTEPVSVDDNGGSLTVDALNLDIRDLVFATDKVDASGSTGVGVTGTFFQATQPVSAVALPLPSGAATAALQLPDSHNVTVDNAAAGAAVNVQDGGNSLTVDWAGTAPPIGAGVEAAALRVTVATDSTGVLSVDDNGASLTVDLAGGTDALIGRVKITDGTDVADVLNLAGSDPLCVAILDGAGAQITSFGGGVEYTEGDTDASITGKAVLWEDTGDTLRAVSAAKPLPVGDAGGSLTVDGTVATKTDLTPSAPTFATVGVASAEAVAAAATRKGLILVNTSGATISLGFGSAAVLNSGVTLQPGGVYGMDEYSFDLGAVYAIASAASSHLAVQEYLS